MTPLRLHQLLGRCLAGRADISPDLPWLGLIALANQHLLSPLLYARLRDHGALAALPDDARDYLALLHDRNAERNRRLAAQAGEAIGALNRRGIEPLLLKGAATLFEGREARMITDLDLVVAPAEGAAALAALAALGYSRVGPAAPHTLGDFARPRDPGAIDLHVALLAEPHLLPLADIRAEPVVREPLRFRVLAPGDRVLHLVLHDLIQDHGYFDGTLHLRHLHELARWMETDVDWERIAAHLARHRLDAALDLACAAAALLFGALQPRRSRRPLARILLWRARLRLRYPEWTRGWEILGNAQRSLAWYRLADRDRRVPRLRRALAYVRAHRARTAERLLHIVFYRRAERDLPQRRPRGG